MNSNWISTLSRSLMMMIVVWLLMEAHCGMSQSVETPAEPDTTPFADGIEPPVVPDVVEGQFLGNLSDLLKRACAVWRAKQDWDNYDTYCVRPPPPPPPTPK